MSQNKKTVFVLGAGASSVYGFPTGKDLKREIIELRGDGELHMAYVSSTELINMETGIDEDLSPAHSDRFSRTNPFFNLAETFSDSGQLTIDEFLRTHQSLIEIGKFLITYVLVKSEAVSNLRQDDWCQLIWSRLAKGVKTPDEINKNFAFITFNYDTSLEYIFSKAIKNTFSGVGEDAVRSFFKEVPIIHVHGKIKNLPWEQNYQGGFEKIGLRSFRKNEILAMSRGIKLFHEEGENNHLEIAKELISGAKNVLFLGFGFDPTNVSKLNDIFMREVKAKVIGKVYNPLLSRGVAGPAAPTRLVETSSFEGKRLFATGIGLNEKQRSDVKKIKGLYSLKFVDYGSIFEYLNAHVDEFLKD